jgi:hypothetical protein
MRNTILEFTLNGHKHTYYRRTNIFGEVVTTTNKNSAKVIKESEVPSIIKKIITQYGKENVGDIKSIGNDNQ